jgi:hypothetical protein
MSNPFPGVDPFIEDQEYWAHFHHLFITFWQSALEERLPSEYTSPALTSVSKSSKRKIN